MTFLLLAALTCVFPRAGSVLPAGTARTYVIGTCEKGAKTEPFYLNGVEVTPWRTGSYLAMVQLVPGTNTLVLTQGSRTVRHTFSVATEVARRIDRSKDTPVATSNVKSTHDPWIDLEIPRGTPPVARPKPGTPLKDIHVMIDPGHGGANLGAISPAGIPEKSYNLLQSLEIAAALKKVGFTVTLTRDEDFFPTLYSRPKRAYAEGATLFISVHHNANDYGVNPRDVRHTTAYASNELGLPLAAAIQRHVGPAVSPVKNVPAQMKSLAVCRNPVVPSCLLEIDFINLPEGEEDSRNPARLKRVADAVTRGVLDWIREGAACKKRHAK